MCDVEKSGDFEFEDFPCYTCYENYKTGKYVLDGLFVYTKNQSGLKESMKKLDFIFQKIVDLDSMARNSFLKEFDWVDEEDLNEIELNNICYYEYGHFELYYDLPKEVELEYIVGIFDEKCILIETTAGNY